MSITVTFSDGTVIKLWGRAMRDFLQTLYREGYVFQSTYGPAD